MVILEFLAPLVKKGDLQWNAGEKKLVGCANWQPMVAPPTWATVGPSTATMQGPVTPGSGGPSSATTAPSAQPAAAAAGFGLVSALVLLKCTFKLNVLVKLVRTVLFYYLL